MKVCKIFSFLSEDVMDPEDEFSYNIENAIDSNSSITSIEELLDFIGSSLYEQIEDELCFLIEDGKNRIIDCGLGSKFASQTIFNNSYLENFM